METIVPPRHLAFSFYCLHIEYPRKFLQTRLFLWNMYTLNHRRKNIGFPFHCQLCTKLKEKCNVFTIISGLRYVTNAPKMSPEISTNESRSYKYRRWQTYIDSQLELIHQIGLPNNFSSKGTAIWHWNRPPCHWNVLLSNINFVRSFGLNILSVGRSRASHLKLNASDAGISNKRWQSAAA